MVSPMHRATTDHAAIDNGNRAPSGAPETTERLAYSIPNAAKAVGISARRMWDLVSGKKVTSFREGQRRLISRQALEEYIEAREAEENA